MPVCKFWLRGSCRNGNNCNFEHPPHLRGTGSDNRSIPNNSHNRNNQGVFGRQDSQPTQHYQPRNNTSNPNPLFARQDNNQQPRRHSPPGGQRNQQNSGRRPGGLPPRSQTYGVTKDVLTEDLQREPPLWTMSSYGPGGSDAPVQLFGGFPIEQSPEEVRMQHYLDAASGNLPQAIQREQDLAVQSKQQFQNVLKNMNDALWYMAEGGNSHPNRMDICMAGTDYTNSLHQNGPAVANNGAFGQPTPIPQAQSQLGGFGQNSAEQTGGVGMNTSQSQPGGFGPNSGQPQPGGFGQNPAQPQLGGFGQNSAQPQPGGFGQNPNPQQTGGFGQNSGLFGQQQPQAAQPSGFGAQQFAAAQPGGFGQQLQAEPQMNGFGQNIQSGFGQPQGGMQPGFQQPQPPQNMFGQPQQPGFMPVQGAPNVAAPSSSPFAAQGAAAATNGANSPNNHQASAPINQTSSLNHDNVSTEPRGADPSTYSTRDANNNLLTWKGRNVTYQDGIPFINAGNGDVERIWFPDGMPPQSSANNMTDLHYPQEAMEAYNYLRESGTFMNDVMPEIPPRPEWVGWDI